MELDTNLITLQGILRDVMKNTGDFSKIKYKGGNEKRISQVIEAVQEYIHKTYPNKDDPECAKHMQNIIVFLTLNTKFENNSLLNIQEYFHLINVIPVLSKCLLANLIVGLELTSYYCSIMLTMPLPINEELLNEITPALKPCEPSQALNDTCYILSNIIKLLSRPNQQDEALIEKLGDISSEMLKNIAGINPELIQNWKKPQIYKHMGYTLLHLLKLLRSCPLYIDALSVFINELIEQTVMVMKAVTINVFCVWAEVKHEHDQPMQSVIAGEAYLVIEHLQKYKPGQELVQMLASIAKRPKSLNEIIMEADVTTMISSINKCDDNQRLWFRGFMNSNVLQNKESIDCLDRWKQLCTKDDVSRLFNMTNFNKHPELRALVINCAKCLNTEDLAFITAKYVRENNVSNLNTGSVKEELTLLLNKPQNSSETDQDFIKNIYTLLLQNPDLVINSLYTECLKKSVNTQRLKYTFEKIKTVVSIRNISKIELIKMFESYPPTTENIANYKELLNVLLELNYFQDNILVNEVFTPQLQIFVDIENYQTLLCILQVLNLISVKLTLDHSSTQTLVVLMHLMEKLRCQFFTFLNMHQQIVQECANLLLKFSSGNILNIQLKDYLEHFEIRCPINKYYISILCDNQDIRFLTFIYPANGANNHYEGVSQLIKFLPLCVTSEWILATKELVLQFGYEETLKLYHDIFLLLCEVTDTQLKPDHENTAINSLIFCLQQHGIAVKEVLQPQCASLEDEILLTKYICRLIGDIPKAIRKEEGVKLTALLTDQSLQSLKHDRDFLLSLVNIEEVTISQTLAQRMLS